MTTCCSSSKEYVSIENLRHDLLLMSGMHEIHRNLFGIVPSCPWPAYPADVLWVAGAHETNNFLGPEASAAAAAAAAARGSAETPGQLPAEQQDAARNCSAFPERVLPAEGGGIDVHEITLANGMQVRYLLESWVF